MNQDLDDISHEEAVRLAAQLADIEINVTDQDLPHLSGEAWIALQAHNDPPTIFLHGGRVVRLAHDGDGDVVLNPLTLDQMRYEVARAASWCRISRGKEKQHRVPVPPPLDVVRDMLATPNPPFPSLIAITGCPVFDRYGKLQQVPGYSDATRIYYAPNRNLAVPSVSDAPSSTDIRKAKELLLEVIEDFPFVADSERAHALALGFLPFLREMIDGTTPLHLIEKPAPGTGGSLLVDALVYPATGIAATALTEANSDEEWRKRITSVLRRGPSVILIDNISHLLSSASLSAVLTLRVWEDRLLGQSETIRVLNRSVWVATGNNPSLSQELARRCVRIRLDAHTDRPWLRQEFRKKDLRAWLSSNRSEVIRAYLTLCQAWIRAGQPRLESPKLGGFESWSEIIGGLLGFIEVPGFLENITDFYEETDSEGTLWRELFTSWWQRYKGAEIGTKEIFKLIKRADLSFDLGQKSDASQRVRLGLLLGKKRDGQFGRFRLTAAGKKQGAQQWKLVAQP